MKWITGEDLYSRLPSWMADAFYNTIMRDIRDLLDIFGYDATIYDVVYEIFREDTNMPMYGVRLYYDNILLREYSTLRNVMVCYFEPCLNNDVFTGHIPNMITALKDIWKKKCL